MSNFNIRTMTRDEVDIAVQLAANEGWNPGLYDATPFFETDPEGFIGGFLDDEFIGCISAVSYSGKFGFIGFYIVIPEYRGKGYGIQLWNAAVKKLQHHNIGLDGVIEQQENYKKSGFKLAYSNIRYEYINPKRNSSNGCVPLKQVPFEVLSDYDQQYFPLERTAFLGPWLKLPESFGLACCNGDDVKGYGIIRKCREGYKIGPLFAEDEVIAEDLFLNLCSKVAEDEKIYLDVPEVNQKGIEIAKKYSMQKVFGTARMYTGPQPDICLDNVFGVTTFELG